MYSIQFTEPFFTTHPNATIGILEISNICNSTTNDPFEEEKERIEESLRNKYSQFTRADFNALPAISAYRTYYKQFKKSYHVQLQIESIALKGKSLPHVSPLVDINFMTEVQTMLLTAGHDVSKLNGPITMDVSREGDVITQLNGKARDMRIGDMIMRDGDSVSCSVIYGQDNHSPISNNTSHVLYVSYCPPGISESDLDHHLTMIKDYIQSFCPEMKLEQLSIMTAENH